MSKKITIKIRQDKLKTIFLEQLKRTPTIEQSCQKVAISRMTVLRWRKASQKFNQEVENALSEGRNFVSDCAEGQMFSLIGQGKPEMIKFFLAHNNPRYSNKLEIKGRIENINEQLTEEQMKVIKEALKLALPQNNDQDTQTKTDREDSADDDEE
jgi:predicted DNA binding protein